jgi:hypothetical protein
MLMLPSSSAAACPRFASFVLQKAASDEVDVDDVRAAGGLVGRAAGAGAALGQGEVAQDVVALLARVRECRSARDADGRSGAGLGAAAAVGRTGAASAPRLREQRMPFLRERAPVSS